MKKILYIMNVDWNWIKQRPHFLAERLSSKFDVTIAYQYRYNRKKLQKRSVGDLNLRPIYLIPKISGISCLSWINTKIMANKIMKIINDNPPDIIFLTYPSQIDFIPVNFSGKIFYDCMDNHSSFIQNIRERNLVELKEKELVNKATKVFVSSEYLRIGISQRYQVNIDKFILVRNAYDGNIIEIENVSDDSFTVKLAYIGTISSWFDWETILNVMKEMNNIELHLYGPIDNTEIPNNNRIYYHGILEHHKLYETIKYMDILVMPFILNDTINAVDPVKVYEYINFDKNIIIRKYPEVERLGEYVYFYNNYLEFIHAIELIKESKKIKYSESQRVKFLRENTWDSRVCDIIRTMEL